MLYSECGKTESNALLKSANKTYCNNGFDNENIIPTLLTAMFLPAMRKSVMVPCLLPVQAKYRPMAADTPKFRANTR